VSVCSSTGGKRLLAAGARTLSAMTISSFVVVGFVTAVGLAACTPSTVDDHPELTAACTDRTNNISCASCCNTENAYLVNNVCTCKGKILPKK
jgi:hypothetical protein